MDQAHKDTDKEIAKVERRIKKIYGQAQKDVQKKMDDFTRKFAVKDKAHRAELAGGKITKEQYDA